MSPNRKVSQFKVINKTLFWSPAKQYVNDHEKILRIQEELMKFKESMGAVRLYYVSPNYSLDGLEKYFGDKESELLI
jgi:hypothetical protein